MIGCKLDKLENKLRNAKKKEKKTNPPSTAAVTNLTNSTPITNSVTTHQSRPTTYVNPLASTHGANSDDSAVHISSSLNSNPTHSSLAAPSSTIYSPTLSTSTQSRTVTETNTAFIPSNPPSIPQCSPSTQRVRCNITDNDSVRHFMKGMSFANGACESPGCHCVPPKTMESRRNETEDGKRPFGDILNRIDYNSNNQNNEECSGQSHEDGGMSLQSGNHNIIIEKCNVFEDGSCHVCGNKLAAGVAIRVDDLQSRDMEYAPECPVWHCIGCWEPTSLLITQLFQHTHDYQLFLCRFAINIKTAISGWLILECRDRLHVISRIFEQNLSTATVSMNDIERFFSCDSTDCHDCSTPVCGRRNYSDDADETDEMSMQIDYELQSQMNSWVDNDIHQDDQSSGNSIINYEEDQVSVQVMNHTSTQDYTSADANLGPSRGRTSTTGRSTTDRTSLPSENSGPRTRSQARGQNHRSTSNRWTGISPTHFDLVSNSVSFCETKCSNCKRYQFDDDPNPIDYRRSSDLVMSPGNLH